MQTIAIPQPFDGHVHFRDNGLLLDVIAYTAGPFHYAVPMPNLTPPLILPHAVLAYKRRIEEAVRAHGCVSFYPVMTFYLTDDTTPEDVDAMFASGIFVGKAYPKAKHGQGGTTNAHAGVSDFVRLRPVFEQMRHHNMICLIHGEVPSEPPMRREIAFLPTLLWMVETFDSLRIVLEHVSSAESVSCIRDMPPNVAATITAHHLTMTAEDVVGDPHGHCMPVIKSVRDREALVEAALSGNPKFYFGSDSAPHKRETKECAEPKAGIFSAPVALPVLAELFESHGKLHRLGDFVSVFGPNFYGLELARGSLTLEKRAWQVPWEIHGIVPFKAGKTLSWQAV